jgi:hypothetical protein
MVRARIFLWLRSMLFTRSNIAALLIAPLVVSQLVAADIAAAITQESILQNTVVQRQAGGYVATVASADPIFAVPVGTTLTVVVLRGQDGLLGQVGVRMGEETIVCTIDTAEGGEIGFSDYGHAGYLSGLFRIDHVGAPKELVLTRGTLNGLSTLHAGLVRLPDPE